MWQLIEKTDSERRTAAIERRTATGRGCRARVRAKGRTPQPAAATLAAPAFGIHLPLAGPAFGKRVNLLARTQNPCFVLGWWVGPVPFLPWGHGAPLVQVFPTF